MRRTRAATPRLRTRTFITDSASCLTKVVAESDVVITAAVIPGKKSPILVTREMVAGMAPGSVIVDLAAERGGNCELTQPGEKVVEHGVTIIGWFNLAATVPYHASQMYARNISAFLLHLVKDGKLQLDMRRRNYSRDAADQRRRSGKRASCASFTVCPRWPRLRPAGGVIEHADGPAYQSVRVHAGRRLLDLK